MSIEPDDDVKPQVIDLEAADVTPKPPPPPPPPRSGLLPYIVLAAVAAVMVAGWYFYQDARTLRGQVDALAAAQKNSAGEARKATELSNQTAVALQATRDETAALVEEMKAGIESRIAAAEQGLQAVKSDIDALRSMPAAPSGGTSVDLSGLTQRLDALEKEVAGLKAGSASAPSDAARAALSQALSDIKAKIAAGASYTEEMDRITRMVPAIKGLPTAEFLTSYALYGLPEAKGLAAELRASIASLPQPEAPASNDGYLSGIWDTLTSVVTIRDIGDVNWPVLAEDAAKLAEAGELAQAIALLDKAEGSIPTAITQWRNRAAARLKLEAAVKDLGIAVESQLAAMGSAP